LGADQAAQAEQGQSDSQDGAADETILARQLAKSLTDAGYAVDPPPDGEEGNFFADSNSMMPRCLISVYLAGVTSSDPA
jgi:hypothetical protein